MIKKFPVNVKEKQHNKLKKIKKKRKSRGIHPSNLEDIASEIIEKYEGE